MSTEMIDSMAIVETIITLTPLFLTTSMFLKNATMANIKMTGIKSTSRYGVNVVFVVPTNIAPIINGNAPYRILLSNKIANRANSTNPIDR